VKKIARISAVVCAAWMQGATWIISYQGTQAGKRASARGHLQRTSAVLRRVAAVGRGQAAAGLGDDGLIYGDRRCAPRHRRSGARRRTKN